MAKQIVEYQLEGGRTPYFIKDGGYFSLETAGVRTLVGVGFDSKKNFTPSSGNANWLNNNQFISRVESMDLVDRNGNALTLQEKTDLANDWLTERGL